jgi:hypothetical protein
MSTTLVGAVLSRWSVGSFFLRLMADKGLLQYIDIVATCRPPALHTPLTREQGPGVIRAPVCFPRDPRGAPGSIHTSEVTSRMALLSQIPLIVFIPVRISLLRPSAFQPGAVLLNYVAFV